MCKLQSVNLKNMTLKEFQINNFIEKYLKGKGWKISSVARRPGEHGADIVASHSKWGKRYIIEIKGESDLHRAQTANNAFWTMLGQVLTRMDIGGNSKNTARYYAIGFPKKWEQLYKNKISNMKYGWKLLKLKVFLVDDKGGVEEKPYSYFLRS